jgi:hypothetical protein
MPGKSILSQLTSPYNKMYQKGGTVGPTKYAGVTQAQPQQPADDTTWGGDFTWGGGDFVPGGGDFVPGGGDFLDWTDENFDSAGRSWFGGGSAHTTWWDVWGSQWGDNSPDTFDYNDPDTWPPGWQPGDEIPGWSEWFTGGSVFTPPGQWTPGVNASYFGPGGVDLEGGGGSPPWWDVEGGAIWPSEGGGVGAGGIFGGADILNFGDMFDDFSIDFWGMMEDQGYSMPEGYGIPTGFGVTSPFGALGMETTEGYEPGKFDANLVRRKPEVAPQVQNVNFDQASLERDILKQLDSPSSQRGGQDEQSQIVDAVLNELRL